MSTRRVVVLRALGLGDLLTAIPALRGLRASFGDARIVLAAPAVLAPLAALSGAVDEVADTAPLSPLDRGPHRAGLAVNLHGRGPQSTRLLLATGPRRLIAFEHADLPATRGQPRWRADEHEVTRWCRLLTEAGIPADPAALGLDRPAVPSPRPGAVIIHPGAASGARRWPADRWAEVARALAGCGHPVVLTGTTGERPLARHVAARAGLPGGSVLAGRTGLDTLAALTASAALVLSGDTGLAHLAAAFARPAVTLAGPVPPRLWGPPSRSWHRVLWAGREGDPHAARPGPGLLALQPGEVIAAARDVLAAGLAVRGPGSGPAVRVAGLGDPPAAGAAAAGTRRGCGDPTGTHAAMGSACHRGRVGRAMAGTRTRSVKKDCDFLVICPCESAAWGGQMAGDLGIYAQVVERARRHRGDDSTGMGTIVRRRSEITALAGRNCPDDQPYQQDEPTDSHGYLRTTGSSCISEEPRDALSSTPYAADTHNAFATARYLHRCIVSADVPCPGC